MKFYYVTFRSATHGQRGERLLNDQGIRCTLVRTPRWMEVKGCGYSLRLWTSEIDKAMDLLRKARVPMQKVYIQSGDGTLEELTV